MKEKVASTYCERKVDNSVKPVVALRSVSRVPREVKCIFVSLCICVECVRRRSRTRGKIEEWGESGRDRDGENLTQRDKLDSYFSISVSTDIQKK